MSALHPRPGPAQPVPPPAPAHRRARRTSGLILVAGLVLAGGLAGCGGSSSKVTSTPSTSTGTSSTFTSCLEKHGVPASAAGSVGHFGGGRPGGTGGSPEQPPSGSGTRPSLPAGVSRSTLQSAFSACRSDLPNGGRFGGGGGQFNSTAFAAYRNCLQVNGVTLPSRPTGSSPSSTTSGSTPPASTGGGTGAGGRAFGGLDPSNPKVAAAEKACASLRPSAGGSSTTSSTAS